MNKLVICKEYYGPFSKKERYVLREGESTLASFNDFTTAAIVCRFIKAGRLNKPEYDKAVEEMNAFDKRREKSDDDTE